MDLIEQGIKNKLISFDDDRKYITYLHQGKRKNYLNPEEQVQAETFLKLVLIYNYPVENIQQYVTVTMGSFSKEADIIVYNDSDNTIPLIIVECKKSEVSELEFEQAIEQGFAYCFATAKTIKYLWVTSGIKDRYFEVNKEKEAKLSIPDIPAYGIENLAKYKYAKGGSDPNTVSDLIVNYGEQKYFELEKVSEDELTRRFKQAHQALWAGGELNPSEAFDELDKLIFCKIWDERHPRKIGEPYLFQIYMEDSEEKTTKALYQRIIDLYAEGKKRDPEVFRDNIRLNPVKVRTVVGYLEGISLSKTDLDSKGRAFEAFMGSYFRGDFGQFFTPRNIVKFIVDVLPLDNKARVLDTSCGSGGFLLYALDKVRNQANEYYSDNSIEHYRYWHDFAEKNLYGIEINEQIARTAKMNMIIHDDGHTNVIASDGLLPSDQMIDKSGNKEFKYNSFDFIITNPPFGSSVKQSERAYMKNYRMAIKEGDWLDVKNSKEQHRANQSTEVMFIEQCYNFLKPGGYLAIVIPDGILTNSSMQYVRDQIEDWYRIVAVVSMPQDAFAHTGAAVKSSVLFLRKYSQNQSEKITTLKVDLQQNLLKDKLFEKRILDLDQEKKDLIKNMVGFAFSEENTDLNAIKQSDEYKEWKTEISLIYKEKIDQLKEQMIDEYLAAKQNQLSDYPIFMAIAENIGYDATGKDTGVNELEVIGMELKRFISEIESENN